MATDKTKYDAYIDGLMPELWDMARYIHTNPEVAFTEHKACRAQCDYLRKAGFEVTEGVAGLETAYTARFEGVTGGPHIAVVSEYDSLPGIGHGCGHNLICTTALATGMAVKRYLEETGTPGTLSVIGTPAEESGGGKIIMLEHGVWDGIDAVFFMHPTSDLTRLAGACMSSMRLHITFSGKSAHAGSHPENGVNALSAANLYFAATGFLRQQFRGDMRLSGIIVDGGRETGLIPDKAEIKGSISSFSLSELEKNTEKVRHCAEGAAHALGCEVEFEAKPGYQGRVPNTILSDVCRAELEDMGEPLLPGMPFDYGGEDLGNVSRIIPICNPYVTIFADHKISNHTEQFRDLANSEAGYRCIQVGGKCMSRSMIDVLEDPSIIDAAKRELSERMAKEN